MEQQMNMSDEFPVDLDQKREDDIIDLAKTLMGVNDSLASLTVIKEELTARMAALLQHRDEGQNTYKVGKYAIVCKSGYIYSLDKEEYEVLKDKFTPGLDPIKVKQSYEINRDMLRKLELYGSAGDKSLVEDLISVKPSKLSVKVSTAS